jgi:sugar phosphate isomerase/epimerase
MTPQLSVQLYSLREELARDFDGTMAQVAAANYAGVEPWGGLPVEPAHAARIFGTYGLNSHSIHLPLLAGGDRQKLLDTAHTLQVQTIVLPSLPEADFKDEDGLKRAADKIAESAAVATAEGFGYGYHNHWWEWTLIDGQSALDRLAALLDASIIFEVDTYWARVAGFDPAQVVARFGKRAPLLHIKDGPADNQQSPMVAVGDGVMNVEAILSEAQAEWAVVELDRCATDMVEAVGKSASYLIDKGWATGRAS